VSTWNEQRKFEWKKKKIIKLLTVFTRRASAKYLTPETEIRFQ